MTNRVRRFVTPLAIMWAYSMSTSAAFSVLAILSAVGGVDATTIKSYHVGNSLTWDTRPTAFADLSAQQGLDHVVGHHIRCGRSLPYIIGHPTETCHDDPVFGTWAEALPAYEWDVVTLQLYPDSDSALGSETDAALNLIDTVQSNPANENTRFIVYGAWPNQVDTDSYADAWLRDTAPDDLSSPSAHSRAYQLAAFHEIDAARPETNISFLSIGELFYLADTNIKSAVSGGDDWLGFEDVSEFYYDEFHMDPASGRWVAALAMWSAITNGDPSNLVRPETRFNPVLDEDPIRRSGLAKFVADSWEAIYVVPPQGNITAGDLPANAANLGPTPARRIRTAFRPTPARRIRTAFRPLPARRRRTAPELVAVPEPSADRLALLASLLLIVRRPLFVAFRRTVDQEDRPPLGRDADMADVATASCTSPLLNRKTDCIRSKYSADSKIRRNGE